MRLPARDVRYLAGANLVSSTGDWLLRTGLAYQVYALTGSTAASATAVLAALIPRTLLGPIAGVYADRWDRRRTVIVTNLLLGACLLPLAAVHGPGQVWILYLVLAAQSGLALLFSTAEAALVPALVGDGDLVTANSLNGQARDVARLAGAALGGLVAGFGGVGLLAAVSAGAYAVAAALLSLIRVTRTGTPAAERRHLIREGLDGLRIAMSTRTLRTIMVFTVVTGIGEAVMSTLMAPFVHDVLHGSARTYGTIMAAQAVGGITGGLITTMFGHRFPPRLLLGGGTVAFGLVDLALFLYPLVSPSPWPAVVLMVVAGLPGALMIAGLMTVFQTATDDSHRGRVFGTLLTLDSLAMLAGTAVAGTLGDRLGIVPVITIQGIGLCTAGLMVLLLLPRTTAPSTRPGIRVDSPPA
ncbi:MFS transporter [Actinoplanes couchii]|uniref:MFS transporter n=1 Tax=Actinoplanes couchii TaxID=403638 RepID=A0ABQ3XM23_9ACTN|nr:MFS transporter [Actinoplanes couchii]MDR6319229.1 putative MFS family arabinose efflux permease [Actinoplanes couchii]GID59561.1 MFS transporter [Actinoplanes couchii]